MKAGGFTLGRSSLILVVFLLLSACVFPAGVTGFALACPEVSEKAVKRINWTQVPEVDLRIRHGEFSPMVVRLRQGWPYVFRIRNRDDRGHAFKAYNFFANVAVIQTSIGGLKEDTTCYGALWIPPRQTAEIRMVAVVDGRYEYENLVLSLLFGYAGGPDGVIIIEERKSRI